MRVAVTAVPDTVPVTRTGEPTGNRAADGPWFLKDG
jgi:hypothetical protein